MYNVQYTVYNIQCTMYTVHCTVYTVQYTVYNVQYIMYNIQCTFIPSGIQGSYGDTGDPTLYIYTCRSRLYIQVRDGFVNMLGFGEFLMSNQCVLMM